MAKLTVQELKALKPENAGERIRDEGGIVGEVRSRADGVSVKFDWRYRFAGKVRQVSLGTWPKDSLADIRGERDKARLILDDGKDPAEEKRADRLRAHAEQQEAIAEAAKRILDAAGLRARMTVRELFGRWDKGALSKRKDKGAEIRRSFEKDVLPTMGDVAAADVTRAMVAGILDSVVERGAPIVARNLLGDVRQMFGFAIARGRLENDPTSHMKRDDYGRKVERDRVLSEKEIKLLRDKLPAANMTDSSVAAIWIMLATVCRVGELSRARWEDVDLDDGTWRIPPANAKNKREHTIVLSGFAVEHFNVLRELAPKSPWVLPATRKEEGHVDVKSLAKQIADRQRAGKGKPMKKRTTADAALALPGGRWTPHDLRRSGATLMGSLGVRPDVIEKCLNHVQQNRMQRIYQRQELKAEQAEAWRLLGKRLELLMRTDAENVVAIRKKGKTAA